MSTYGLHTALRYWDWDLVARLASLGEEGGVDVNALMEPQGTPPLVMLADMDLLQCRKAVTALMKAGADPFRASSVGECAAEIALLKNGRGMVSVLMQNPKEWENHRFRGHRTVLHVVAQRHAYADKLIPWLCLELTLDLEALDIGGNRPLHTAAAYNSVEAVNGLLEKGALVNAFNLHGQTPLAVAILNGSDEAAEALIKAGGKASNTHLASPKVQRVLLTRSLDESESPQRRIGGWFRSAKARL